MSERAQSASSSGRRSRQSVTNEGENPDEVNNTPAEVAVFVSPPPQGLAEESAVQADEPRSKSVSRQLSRKSTAVSGVVLDDFGMFDPEGIYAAVRLGFCVNEEIDPRSGDSLLHAAARNDAVQLVMALLQCGADTRLRNRLGVSAVDVAGPGAASILAAFQPCLPEAVDSCNAQALRHLCFNLWVNLRAILRNGYDALQLIAQSRLEKAPNCFNVVMELTPLSTVTHALMAGDLEGLENALREGGFLPPGDPDHLHRIRQYPPGPDGRTLLTVALDRGDVNSAKLLLEAGASPKGRQTTVGTGEQSNQHHQHQQQQSRPLVWSALQTSEVAVKSSLETGNSEQQVPTLSLESVAEPPLDLMLEYDPVAVLTQRDSSANTVCWNF